ncbi:hypothetical protein MBLNU457_5264t1 [Dothideomycetes sp. NU457]
MSERNLTPHGATEYNRAKGKLIKRVKEEEVEYEAYLESLPNAYLQFDDEDDEDDEDDKDNEDNEDDEDDEDDEGDEGNEGEDDRKDDEDDDIAINKTDK